MCYKLLAVEPNSTNDLVNSEASEIIYGVK